MMDFFNEANWWCLFLLLLIAFLLGWFLSRWASKNKYKEALEKCEREKQELSKVNLQKAQTTFNQDKITSATPTEKAPETITPTPLNNEDKPKLNFESFGIANEADKDDLKLISGIGPFIEKKLNSIGIYTFDQISRFTKEDIETVTKLIEFFPGRIERDDWKLQASKLKET